MQHESGNFHLSAVGRKPQFACPESVASQFEVSFSILFFCLSPCYSQVRVAFVLEVNGGLVV